MTQPVDAPLVSIVTPFYNSASWLRESIESVLAQTYQHFEYVLVDNCSTDGSTEIALEYAARDPRIRYVRNAELLPQIRNYNTALALISNESRDRKMVQADDWIFPECIRSMVGVFESADSIGLVSSYYLKGALLYGGGLPYPSGKTPGPDIVRLVLRAQGFFWGSPSAHMYRASIIRAQQPFYDEARLHDDTEACIRILKQWDFGFVHQVLSFSRVGNESVTSRVATFEPYFLDHYILVRRYAADFFESREAAALNRETKTFYYGFLAGSLLKARRPAFWRYHRQGLKTMGEDLDVLFLLRSVIQKVAWFAVNPGRTLEMALRRQNAR